MDSKISRLQTTILSFLYELTRLRREEKVQTNREGPASRDLLFELSS
jgi:hypothetical protein